MTFAYLAATDFSKISNKALRLLLICLYWRQRFSRIPFTYCKLDVIKVYVNNDVKNNKKF